MLLTSLLVGAIIGIVLALPPGPVGVTTIKLGMFNGRKSGTWLAFGNGIMDFFYSLFAIFASSAAIATVNSFSDGYPFLMVLFQAVVVIVFIILGVINLRSKKTINPLNETEEESKFIHKFKTKGPFWLGCAIALTNIANPSFLPSLTWIAMNVHSHELIENAVVSNLMFSLGFGLGNFLWLFSLVRIVERFKNRMSPNTIIRLRQFAGVTFLSFGTILGYRLLTITKWPELVRFVFAF